MHRFRFHYLIALLALVTALSACGGKSDSPSPESKDSTAGKDDNSSATDQAPGETVTSDSGRFVVQFPEGFPAPKQQTQTVQTKIGPLAMITYLTEEKDAACMVAYSDYPETAFDGADVNALLDSARNGALNNVNGKMTSEEQITLNGHPGRSIIFAGSSQGQTIHGRFDYYLVKPRLYQVGFMAIDSAKLSDDGTKSYFKSFSLSGDAKDAKDGK